MNKTSSRTAVALFVALTRGVRDAALSHESRLRAFELLDRMAGAVGHPSFASHLEAFAELATRDPVLHAVLRPMWTELRALSPEPTARTGKIR